MKTVKELIKSFGYAFSGIAAAVRSERNFRIHIVAAGLVAGFGAVYGLTASEWAIIAITIALVLSSELFNTAVEAAVDRTGKHTEAFGKTAKDCAAGAVLVLAMAAVAVAICIFSDTARLFPALISIFTTPIIFIFITYAILSLIFIKWKNSN